MSLDLAVNLVISFLLLNVGTIILVFLPVAIIYYLIKAVWKSGSQTKKNSSGETAD